MSETHDEARRLNGMSAEDAAARMQTIWEQIQRATDAGVSYDERVPLYEAYLAAVGTYDSPTRDELQRPEGASE